MNQTNALLKDLATELAEGILWGESFQKTLTSKYDFSFKDGSTTNAIHAALIGRVFNLSKEQRLSLIALSNSLSLSLLNFDRVTDRHEDKIKFNDDLAVNGVNWHHDNASLILQSGLSGHLHYATFTNIAEAAKMNKLFGKKQVDTFLYEGRKVYYDVLFRSYVGKVLAKTNSCYEWGLKKIDAETAATESRYNVIPGLVGYLFLPKKQADMLYQGFRFWGIAYQIDDDLIDVSEDTTDPHQNYGIGVVRRQGVSVTEAISICRNRQVELLQLAHDCFNKAKYTIPKELISETTIKWAEGNIFRDLLLEAKVLLRKAHVAS